jgi:hypothetical protein
MSQTFQNFDIKLLSRFLTRMGHPYCPFALKEIFDFKCVKVLTAVTVKMAVFWVVAPCTLVTHRPDDGGSTDL